MLAKIWKKALLAVCIIACIFNIMSKLVNRHSLKENLESVNDGETIFSIFQKEEVVETESEPIIEGVMTPETTENVTETASNTTTVVEKTNENVEQETVKQEATEEDKQQDKKDEVFKFSDFQILFQKNT